MKLDRNINPNGRGKYALVNMRKLGPILDKGRDRRSTAEQKCVKAFRELLSRGVITIGNESPGEQFFVMKYKDQFTAEGLDAYAHAVAVHAVLENDESLSEYAAEIQCESARAREVGDRIPD